MRMIIGVNLTCIALHLLLVLTQGWKLHFALVYAIHLALLIQILLFGPAIVETAPNDMVILVITMNIVLGLPIIVFPGIFYT